MYVSIVSDENEMVLNCREVDVVAMAKKLGELILNKLHSANADKQEKQQIGAVPTKLNLAERIIFNRLVVYFQPISKLKSESRTECFCF